MNTSITITPSPTNPKHVDICYDEDLFRTVDKKQFKYHFKTLKACESRQELEETFTDIEQSTAKSYALYLLGLKAYLSSELHNKMAEKGISNKVAQHVIDYLTNLGYLDDKSWIESFVRSQLRKGQGRRVIEQKLKRKGASSHLFDPILDQSCSGEMMNEKIEALLRKKYASRDLTDPKERNKAVNFLMRRGFDYGDIKEALTAIINLSDEL